MREFKRPERFIALAQALPEYVFTMIGGPGGSDSQSIQYYERIRSQASRVRNLSFLGFIHPQEVEAHFDHAQLLVNTSDVEGFPNTFLQAWARGIPTVSWFDPGCMHHGLPVVSVVTDGAEARAAVRALMDDRQHWKTMGARCREYFDAHHSVSSVIESYRLILDSVMFSSPCKS